MSSGGFISEKTWIPVSAVTIIFAAAVWLTTVWRQGDANAQQLVELKNDIDKKDERIYLKLEKINDKLDMLLEKKNGN